MITLSHVYKSYLGPVHALRDVSFCIAKGEFVFLTGPSGAGKTTLFKMLSAFDRPTSGSVSVGDYKIEDLNHRTVSQYRQGVGVVFQDFKLLKDRSLFENIALPLRVRGEKENLVQKKVKDMIYHVGLEHRYDFLPESCSGGEQQRAAIARALVHQPGLLIADEPTGNLDPDLAEEIMELFERASAQGTTILVATHDHEMVKRRKKRVISLQQGKLVEPQFAQSFPQEAFL